MDAIFNQYISIYRNVRDVQGAVTLLSNFLESQKHRDTVMRIRSISDKRKRDEEKIKLPLVTVSGLFSPTRCKDNLKRHSGFLCLDIDLKDNRHFADIEQVRPILESRPEICYAAHSVSGLGYFALVRLAYPDHHEQQFRQLVDDYERLGVKLDMACGDVTRLRCVSWDDNPYINANADVYTGIKRDVIPSSLRPAPVFEDNDFMKVQRCCEIIQRYHIDITDSYEDWFTVGASLSSLGENGRYWFHVCSSQNSRYQAAETDRKFNECMRSVRKIGIATFFYLCRQYGIKYCARENV